MINLIPPEGHRIMKREYFLRVSSTILLLFSGVIVVLTIALVPAFVLVEAQIKPYELEKTQKSDDTEAYRNVEKEVQETINILNQLKVASSLVSPSSIIEEIQNQTPDSIIYKSFQVNTSGTSVDTILVQGIAPTREILARTKTQLENSEMFEKAEVPIADLARENSLPFTITITPTRNK